MRFALGDFTSAGAEILDGRDMSVAYYDADTEDAALAYVEFRNLLHEKLARLAREAAEAEARARADFADRFGERK